MYTFRDLLHDIEQLSPEQLKQEVTLFPLGYDSNHASAHLWFSNEHEFGVGKAELAIAEHCVKTVWYSRQDKYEEGFVIADNLVKDADYVLSPNYEAVDTYKHIQEGMPFIRLVSTAEQKGGNQ